MAGARRLIVWTALGLGLVMWLIFAYWLGPRLVAFVPGLPGLTGSYWAGAYGWLGGDWWFGGPPRFGAFMFWPSFLFFGPLNPLVLGPLAILVLLLINRRQGRGETRWPETSLDVAESESR